MKYQLFLLGLLLFSCSKGPAQNSTDVAEKESVYVKADDDSARMAMLDSRYRESERLYREYDSLVELMDKHPSMEIASKIDSICNKADGELSEGMGAQIGDWFIGSQFKLILDYLIAHPNACLKKRLVWECIYRISDCEQNKRYICIERNKSDAMRRADSLGLSERHKEVITEIFAKVAADSTLVD